MNRTRSHKLARLARGRDHGAVAVVVALSLTVLIGFTALVVDLGHLYVVRNELQNAADSAALAGARSLYTKNGLDWTNAAAKATSEISLNNAAGVALVEGSVQTGYRNLGSTSSDLQPTSTIPGADDLPAVKVQIDKKDSSANGPVSTFFAKIWGISSLNTSATAVAIVSSPGRAGAGVLFPFVITECMYDKYWDSKTGQPTLTTSFPIVSAYHAGDCGEAGQWTSLDTDSNNVPTIRRLIADHNSRPLGIGDDVYIQPGTKTTLYSDVDDCSAAGDKSCEYVMVAVVEDIITHAKQPIVGFACLRILSATGGSGKYITVQMVGMGDPHCTFSGTSGTGPAYGVTQPPRLSY